MKSYFKYFGVFLFFLLATPANAYFSDVNSETEFESEINFAYEHGIVNGYEDDTFRPEKSVSRAEFTKMLIKTTDIELINICDQEDFTDLDSTAWYIIYIRTAQCEDIVNGYPDKTFKPDNTISYAEAAKIVIELLNLNLSEFNEEVWFESYIKDMKYYGLQPRDEIKADHQLTRAELTRIVYLIKTTGALEKNESFVDLKIEANLIEEGDVLRAEGTTINIGDESLPLDDGATLIILVDQEEVFRDFDQFKLDPQESIAFSYVFSNDASSYIDSEIEFIVETSSSVNEENKTNNKVLIKF